MPAAYHILEPGPTNSFEDEDDDEYENEYVQTPNAKRQTLTATPTVRPVAAFVR
jgi:hypothetical protein